MKILTPTGFQDYYCIHKKKAQCLNIVFLDNTHITCSTDHRFDNDGIEIVASKLKVGDKLCGKEIKKIEDVGEKTVYTPVMVQNGNKYLSNGLVNYNCQFLGSTATLVEGEVFKSYIPIEPMRIEFGYDLHVFEDPIPGIRYAMGVDSSTGVGQDYCAFQILKIESQEKFEQVAVFKNNKIKPFEYAKIVAKLSERYNNAMMVIENNDCGRYVTDELWYNIGCPNVLNTDKKGIGTRATSTTKLDACMMLKKAADSRKLILHDADTIYQLSRFEQVSPNHFRGAKGVHDDLVSSLYWAIYCINQPQFDLESLGGAPITNDIMKNQDEYVPPPCLFDETNDQTDFWRSFN